MFLFYILVFLTIFIFIAIKQNRQGKKIYIIIMFFILGCLMMFRSPRVGNDTSTYADLFRTISSHSDLSAFLDNTRYEVGFVLLCKFLSFISNDAQILFIVTGAFIAYSFGRFIYIYSNYAWMSILMFLTLQFFDTSLSGVRQVTSIAILLFSYKYTISRKPIKFLVIVFLASLMHTSALLFLVLYPMVKLKQNKIFYTVSVIGTILIYITFPQIIGLLEKAFPQYVKYFLSDGSSYSASATLAIFLMFLLWTILFYIANRLNNETNRSLVAGDAAYGNSLYVKTKYVKTKITPEVACENSLYEKTKKSLEVAAWIGVLTLFMALQGTILGRLKYVFLSAMLVYYPNALEKIKDPKAKFILVVGSCFIFVLYSIIIYTYRPEWQSTYPYEFFWAM